MFVPLVFGSGSPAVAFSHLAPFAEGALFWCHLAQLRCWDLITWVWHTRTCYWFCDGHNPSSTKAKRFFLIPSKFCSPPSGSAMFIPAWAPLSRTLIGLYICFIWPHRQRRGSQALAPLVATSSESTPSAWACCSRTVAWLIRQFLLCKNESFLLKNPITEVITTRSGAVVWTCCQNQTGFVWLNTETPVWVTCPNLGAKTDANQAAAFLPLYSTFVIFCLPLTFWLSLVCYTDAEM